MATSGYFYTSGWSDATCTDCYIFSWSLSSQNVEGNYSVISWSLKGAGGVDGYWTNVQEKYVTVNGSTQSNSTIQKTYNGTVAFSGTTTIYHNSDGTKSFSAFAGGAFYYFGSYNSTGSGTWELPAIPRASTMSFGEFTMGTAGTITITPANASFTHTISYHFGNKTGTIVTKTSNTSVSWTPPLADFASQIPNDVRGYGSLTITTYSGSTTIGSKKYTMYCNLPTSVVPTVGAITLDPVNITTRDGTSRDILVKGKNKLTLSVSGCSAGTGSSIASYTYSGQNTSSGVISSTSYTSASNIDPAISGASSTLTYTVKVTDTRGRAASSTKTISCYNYDQPEITSFNAYRVASSSSTAENDNGTYIYCTYTAKYYSVNNTNKIYSFNIAGVTSSNVTYNSWTTSTSSGVVTATGSAIISNCAITSAYKLTATLVDNYGVTATSAKTVFSAERILNVRPSGSGIALGKIATTDNVLDSKWSIKTDGTITAAGAINTSDPATTMKNLTYKGNNVIASAADDTITNWAALQNLATTYYNGNGSLSAKPSGNGFLINISGGGTQIHQLWTEQNSGADGSLFHRGGNSNGWYSWRQVLDTSNYTTYVSPKPSVLYDSTSGTTGTVTLSSSAANFSYLEIFLYKDNTSGWWSVKVPSPNGKVVQVGTTYYTNASGVGLQVIGKTVTISGTSITAGTEFYMNFNDSTGAVKAIGGQTSIKIMRVVGYN